MSDARKLFEKFLKGELTSEERSIIGGEVKQNPTGELNKMIERHRRLCKNAFVFDLESIAQEVMQSLDEEPEEFLDPDTSVQLQPDTISQSSLSSSAMQLALQSATESKKAGDYRAAIRFQQLAIAFAEESDVSQAELANLLISLAQLFRLHADYQEAEQASRRSLTLLEGQEDSHQPIKAEGLNELGLAFMYLGKYEQSEPELNQALTLWRQWGTNDDLSAILNNLGFLYRLMDQYQKSETVLREAIDLQRSHSALHNLGMIYIATGRVGESEPLFLEALNKLSVNQKHPKRAIPLIGLGKARCRLGRQDEGESNVREAVEIYSDALGENSPLYAFALNELGKIYLSGEKFKEAEKVLQEQLQIRSRTLGEDHRDYGSGLNNLATLYRLIGRTESALEAYERAYTIVQAALGNEHRYTKAVRYNYISLKREVDGETWSKDLADCVSELQATLDPTSSVLDESRTDLAMIGGIFVVPLAA